MVVFLSESDVRALLTMSETLDILKAAFADYGRGEATLLPRISRILPGSAGMFRILAATLPSQQMFGLKTLTGSPGSRLDQEVYFVVLLFGMESGALRAVVSANYLTGLRTGAASGVAARYLAREDAHTLGVVGAGLQAWFQVEAMCAVREIRFAKIFSRNRGKAEAFAQRLGNELSLDATAVSSAEDAVRETDLVIAATTASEPVIQGTWLRPGTHVSGIGANTRTKRELDSTCFIGARVFADSRDQVLDESGDVRLAIESGAVTSDIVCAELGDLAAGLQSGRTSEAEITIFKSVGVALQDVAVESGDRRRSGCIPLLRSVGPNATLVPSHVIDFARKLKAERARDIDFAGAELANALSATGLVDEYRLYLRSQVLGAGKPYFADPVPPLRLRGVHSVGQDVAQLTYVPA